MNSELIENNQDEEEEILLSFPVAKKDLGDFVSSLLGQQQALERTYPINFEIDHAWLINLNECIDQRISQQAECQLVNFNAVIYFDNGTKRSINSLESFRAYIETKPLISIGVKISWEYLVNFPKKRHPEKQQISFTAFTSIPREDSFRTTLGKLIDSEKDASDSFINIQIDHTERTWGDDVETVISSCIEDVHIRKGTGDICYKFSRLIIAFLAFFIFLLYPIFMSQIVSSDLIVSSLDTFEKLKSQNVDLNLINNKLDHLYQIVSTLEQTKHKMTSWTLALPLITPIIVGFFLLVTQTTTKSFILLTNKTKELKTKNSKKHKKKILIVVVSYLASIAASIVATYGFNFLNGS